MNMVRRVPRPDWNFHGGPGGGPPGSKLEPKAKDFKGTVRRLFGYLKPYRLQLYLVLITALFSTVFGIAGPKIMGMAITRLYENMVVRSHGSGTGVDFSYILHILLILGALYILSAVFNYIQQIVLAEVAQKTVFDMRRDVEAKISRLPLRFFDTHTHGEILSRAANDVDNISGTLQQSVIQVITGMVMVTGILVIMMTISPLLTLISILLLPLYVWIAKSSASRSQKFYRAQQKKLGELNGHIEEMFTGHKTVKAFGYEHKAIGRFDRINEELSQAGWKAQFISGMMMPQMVLVSNISYVLICVAGAILVTRGVIKVGDIMAFIQYSRQIQHPIIQIANIANIIQSTVASAERVFELLDEDEETPDPSPAKTINLPRGHIEMKEVSFRYRPDTPLIENMNMDIAPGQTVAIVGPTGAGKTTLVNLLMRFYEIDSGEILIDGTPIHEFKREDLRSLFAMVLQDSWLFNGSIRENIAYGREDAREEDIVQAARAAHADHFVRCLPEGYDTVLNEEASNLSLGQKQLLTIARAMLAEPAILILDEATSSVDTRTEIHIQQALAHLMKGRTSFVIAHRLSTIRDADLILVMNHGRIIETGKHPELLARGGFYADLFNSQFTQAQ